MNSRCAMSWASLGPAGVALERLEGRRVEALYGAVSRLVKARGLAVEGAFGPVSLLVRHARRILLGAYDDVARGEASGDPARLDRAPVVGGPPALGTRDIPSERGAQVPAHVSATGHDIERVTLGVEADVLAGEDGGGATGGGEEER